MEEKLNEALEKDEKLLWSGRPEPFETLDKTHKSPFIKSTVITLVVSLGLIAAYLSFTLRGGAETKVGLVVIIALLAAYMVASTFLHSRQLRTRMGYAITDRRLILIKDEAKGVPYSQIPIAAMKTDADGHSTLLCGEYAIKSAPRKWRGSALLGGRMNSETGLCDELVMYAIPEPERVREILKPYLTLN